MIYLMHRYVRAPPNLTERARMLPSPRFESKDLPKQKPFWNATAFVLSKNYTIVQVFTLWRSNDIFNAQVRARSAKLMERAAYVNIWWILKFRSKNQHAKTLKFRSKNQHAKTFVKCCPSVFKTNLSAICLHSDMSFHTTKYYVNISFWVTPVSLLTDFVLFENHETFCRHSPCF